MSASDHLSPAQFYYHGTVAELRPGDMVEAGHPVTSRSGKLDNVIGEHKDARAVYTHAASHPGLAANYALRAAIVAKGGYQDLPQQRVYQVTPTGAHERDPDDDPGPNPPSIRSRAPMQVVRELPESEWWAR